MLDESYPVAADHVCRVVHSPKERTAEAAAWARRGLSGGERVLCAGRKHDRDKVLRSLDADGVDWRQAAQHGHLVLVCPEQGDLGDPENQLHRRLRKFEALLDDSLDRGYAGLRVADDVSAALGAESEPESVFEYEERLDELCTTNMLSAMCFYDRRRFGTALRRWAQAHQCLVDDSLQAQADSGRLRISGEMDFSNVALVGATLDKAVPPVGDLVVDLRGLSFIDVRGVEQLVELSRRVAPTGRVKIIDPPVAMWRVLEISGWGAGFDFVDRREAEA